MDILLINHYAGSVKHGMEYRPFYLAREWRRLGHRVTIAAASNSHVRTSAPSISGSVTEEEIEGIRYLWFRTPAYQGNGIKRAANMLAFTWQLLRHRNLLACRCQHGAVIASSTYPLDAVPGRYVARRSRAKFIFEVHDLWPLSPIQLGNMSPSHPFIQLLQAAENFAYRGADAVVSILPKAQDHMREHGLKEGRFFHIPNGIDVSEWHSDRAAIPVSHRDALTKLREKGHSIVMYAGAHGIANALESMIKAAYLLRERPVSFVLVGKGNEKAALKAMAIRLGAANVVFLDPVEKAAIPNLLRSADVLIITLQRSPLFQFGISPNKLIDYMCAGKPIIQSIEAGNDMVSDSRCGISVPAETPSAIADAVIKLVQLSDAERTDMGARAQQYVHANHDYRVLAKRFLDVLKLQQPISAPADPQSARHTQILPS